MNLIDGHWALGGLASALLIAGGLTFGQSGHSMMYGSAMSDAGRSGMMDGMQGCMGMMQDGRDQRPNEQWRQR
jgi:hypothetical protein